MGKRTQSVQCSLLINPQGFVLGGSATKPGSLIARSFEIQDGQLDKLYRHPAAQML